MRVGSSENGGGGASSARSVAAACAAERAGPSEASGKRWSLVKSSGASPTARSGHSAVVAKESLYIFGGCGHPTVKKTADTTRGHVAINAAPGNDSLLPPELQHDSENGGRPAVAAPAAAAVEATDVDEDAMPVCLGDLHVYDLARQSWSEVSSPTASSLNDGETSMTRPAERTCAAMCSSQDEERLFLSGGAGDDPDDLRADLLEYDVRHRTWRLLFNGTGSACSDGACRRIGHAMVHDAARNRLVVFGGSTGFEYFDDTHAFDLSHGIWTTLNTTGERPSPRYKHQAFVDGDWMYVVGGGSFEPEGPDLDVFRLHLSEPSSLKWERVRPIGNPPRCRAAHGLAWDQVGRAAYIWGGFTSRMELDSTFCALRLPPAPADAVQPPTPPLSVPVATPVNATHSAAASSLNTSNMPSTRQSTAMHVRTASLAGGVARVGSSNSSHAVPQAEPTAAVAGTRSKPGGTAVGGNSVPVSTDSGVVLAGSNATDTQEQQAQQIQRTSSPTEDSSRHLDASGHPDGRDSWRRRSHRLWRPTGENGDSPRRQHQQQQRPRRRSSRGGAEGRRTWGQGWATGRLQGLWGGAAAASPAAVRVNGTPIPSPSSSSPPPPPAQAAAVPMHVPTATLTRAGGNGGLVAPPGAPLPPLPRMRSLQAPESEAPIQAAGHQVCQGEPEWMSLPSGEQSGDADTTPSPAGRSFHCAFFHAGACYVTGGSDGARKFGDMWRFAARETPPPLMTLAARAVVLAEQAATAKYEQTGTPADCGSDGGRQNEVQGTRSDADVDTFLHGPGILKLLPIELRAALENLNMQAEMVI